MRDRPTMEKMTSFWERFVQFITFINLPIRKKFLLFEMGTFFWFCVIGVVSVGSLSFIHFRYAQIANVNLPYIKAIQTIRPELVVIARTIALREEGTHCTQTLFALKTSLAQMKNAFSEALISVQKQPNSGNIFEIVLTSISIKIF
jgi:hypothetical protein